MTDRSRRMLLVLMAAGLVLVCDQLSKWWALEALAQRRTIDLIWTLRLRLVFNQGSAFGLFQNLGPVLGVIAVLVAVALVRSKQLASGPVGSLAIGVIVGGALGNLADRLFRSEDGFLGGAVVDFIDVQWWPVWNVADMAIVVGAIVLAVCNWPKQKTYTSNELRSQQDSHASAELDNQQKTHTSTEPANNSIEPG